MKILLGILISFLVSCKEISTLAEDYEPNEEIGVEEPEEQLESDKAFNYGLSIVNKVMKKDFENFKEEFYYQDYYYSTESHDEPINWEDIDFDRMARKYDLSDYTFDDYTENYEPYILDSLGVEQSETYSDYISSLTNFEFTSNDYMFVGFELKDEGDGFFWDDLLIYIINCEEICKIKAFAT